MLVKRQRIVISRLNFITMAVLDQLKTFTRRHQSFLEMTGVMMRIFSFSLVSWMGPKSPFMFVWTCNTADALLLTWCAVLKKDRAYTLLNFFWILVGIIGVLRAAGIIGGPAA